MTQLVTLTGGCQCGAVRYSAGIARETAHLCHCRMCQKATGNYFMPLASAPLSALTITRGTISTFASSAAVKRGFCNRCGTPLTFELGGADSIGIALGSLDNPAAIEPCSQSGVESRMPWFRQLAALRQELSGAGEKDEGARIAQVAASNRQHPDHPADQWPGNPAPEPARSR